jgi:hypothetical protein
MHYDAVMEPRGQYGKCVCFLKGRATRTKKRGFWEWRCWWPTCKSGRQHTLACHNDFFKNGGTSTAGRVRTPQTNGMDPHGCSDDRLREDDDGFHVFFPSTNITFPHEEETRDPHEENLERRLRRSWTWKRRSGDCKFLDPVIKSEGNWVYWIVHRVDWREEDKRRLWLAWHC